jgi:DNA-binding MarR family transcriptional regulator
MAGGHAMSDLRQLFNEVIRFEIEIWNGVDARLRSEFNLPLTHFEPMSVIDRHGSCRVYEIATELGITTGGASKLIDRIEADGFCRRRPNPEDRRSSLLELTPAGKRLLRAAGAAFDDELERRLGGLSTRSVEQLLSTLTRLRAAGHQVDVIDETA